MVTSLIDGAAEIMPRILTQKSTRKKIMEGY